VSPTIAGELSAAAAEYPDGAAIYFEAERRTFSELREDVWQAARGLLASGLAPGDRVALWVPNTLAGAVALLAVVVAGGVVVPMNTRYRSHEVSDILRSARCRMVVAAGSFLGRSFAGEALEIAGGVPVICQGTDVPAGARPWPEILAASGASQRDLEQRIQDRSGDDVAVVQFTSGTTGQPKGVMLRQGPMLETAATWSAIAGLGRQDVYPVNYPLAHPGGYKTGLFSPMVARAAAALLPVVTTETVSAVVSTHRPAVLNAPPAVLHSLLAAVGEGTVPASTRIRTIVTGSSIVPPRLIRELSSVLGVADVINAYGLTEASGVCTMTRRGDPVEIVCETVGAPIDGVEVRTVPSLTGGDDVSPARAGDGPGDAARNIGQIEVRGRNVMAGYLDNPAATAEVMDDGWLRTGDIGWIGADGYVRIVGRAKDMVVVGGFNVYPAEVEQVLADHPDVGEAAVVGVPDERLGEVAVAFVVPSAAAPEPDTLVQWCRDRLANFKVPRQLWIVDGLPKGAVGKVSKPALRARAIALLDAPQSSA
jgi:acyl-CoA synthetase (AMP-forming)/AMP-acid ligase II